MTRNYFPIIQLSVTKIVVIFSLFASISMVAQTADQLSVMNTPKHKSWWSSFGGQGKKGGYFGTSLTLLSPANFGISVEASSYREQVTITSINYNAGGVTSQYSTLYTNRLNAYMCRMVKDFDLRSRLTRFGVELGAGISRIQKYYVNPQYDPMTGNFSENAMITWDRLPGMSAKIRYSLIGSREFGVEFAVSLYTTTSQTYWAGSIGIMIGRVRDPHFSKIKNRIM